MNSMTEERRAVIARRLDEIKSMDLVSVRVAELLSKEIEACESTEDLLTRVPKALAEDSEHRLTKGQWALGIGTGIALAAYFLM